LEETKEKAKEMHEKSEVQYNKGAHPLRSIPHGATVRVQDPVSKKWDKTGVIMQVDRHRRYRIRFEGGSALWRNRRFIRLDQAEATDPPDVTNLPDVPASPTQKPNKSVHFQEPMPTRQSSRKTQKPKRFRS
jgi:hypothetical protein